MEELHRLHKDVPFGWVAMLQDVFAKRARKAAARRAATRRPTAACHKAGEGLHVAGRC